MGIEATDAAATQPDSSGGLFHVPAPAESAEDDVPTMSQITYVGPVELVRAVHDGKSVILVTFGEKFMTTEGLFGQVANSFWELAHRLHRLERLGDRVIEGGATANAVIVPVHDLPGRGLPRLTHVFDWLVLSLPDLVDQGLGDINY